MIHALNDNAFSPYLTPEGLWRASCQWAAEGHTEHAEWLHEVAVDLLDIIELPTCDEPVARIQQGIERYPQNAQGSGRCSTGCT